MHGFSARLIQRAWRAACTRRLVATRRTLRDLSTCVVCCDECTRLVRCANGHACCAGCTMSTEDNRCPVCREPRPLVHDAAFQSTLVAANARLACLACNVTIAPAMVEQHRAWCPSHRYVCPHHACTHCVPAAEMARHMFDHDDVLQLHAREDGAHHLVLALQSVESVIALVGATVVVVTSAPLRRYPDVGLMHVTVRAYYPGPMAPAVHCVVRQVRASDTQWVEEHRLGVIPPMLASREAAVVGAGAVVTPRNTCVLAHDSGYVAEGPPNAKKVRQAGLRDLPLSMTPLLRLDVTNAVALTHVLFREDAETCIADMVQT